MSIRIAGEEISFAYSASKEGIIVIRSFSVRELPHEMPEQKCPMRKLIALDRHRAAEPATSPVLEGSKTFAKPPWTSEDIDDRIRRSLVKVAPNAPIGARDRRSSIVPTCPIHELPIPTAANTSRRPLSIVPFCQGRWNSLSLTTRRVKFHTSTRIDYALDNSWRPCRISC